MCLYRKYSDSWKINRLNETDSFSLQVDFIQNELFQPSVFEQCAWIWIG